MRKLTKNKKLKLKNYKRKIRKNEKYGETGGTLMERMRKDIQKGLK